METALLNTTASDFDLHRSYCLQQPMKQIPAYPVSSQNYFLSCQLSVGPSRSDAAANLTLLISLPRRQLGWAKKSHRSALPRIYIQVEVSQHSGCPVAFVKFMFSRLPSAAEPGKACQHSTALCLPWDFTGDASSSESSLERRLHPAVSSPDHLLLSLPEISVISYRK